jgi:Protein of unknown function (DUF5672)
MKLPLTLCAIDHVAHPLTRLALERSLKQVDFADVLILSDRDILPGARHVRTHAANKLAATRLLWTELPRHVKTERYLYIQWDSWVINSQAWSDQFLQYDYIGAPWPDHYLWPDGCDPGCNVGNGGFSIRSVALAQAVQAAAIPFYSPEDHAICITHRRALEQRGLKWPTYDVAERFSAELRWPDRTPFGFHGAFHFASVLTPDEYDELVELATPYVRETKTWLQLHEHLQLTRQNVLRPKYQTGPLSPEWRERLGYTHS